MGNQNPKGDSGIGKIFVQTDKPYYYGGETVHGKIYLDLEQDFKGAKIKLKIEGEERTEWEETKRIVDEEAKAQQDAELEANPPAEGMPMPSVPMKTIQVDIEGEKEFYNNKATLYKAKDDTLEKGQYQIGFNFALKDKLPASFDYDEKDLEARIKYTLKAIIESDDDKDLGLKWKQELIIHEKISGEEEEASGHKDVDVASCWCIGQGKSKIKVTFDKQSYIQGEESKIMCAIDNSECKCKIPKIFCNLNRYLVLEGEEQFDEDNPDDGSNPKRKKIFNQPLRQDEFDGVDAGQNCGGDNAKYMLFPLKSKLDKHLDPSTKGDIVQCYYTLNVNGPFEGSLLCCQALPSVTSKVQIQAKKPDDYGKTKEPEGWNPTDLGEKSLAFGDDTKCEKKKRKKKKKH